MRVSTVSALALAIASLVSTPSHAENVLNINIEDATTWVRNFNPFIGESARQSTLDFIYEPLVVFNKMQSGKPYPRLATDFKLADDLKSVVFDLRPGVKWSDGQDFTASDVTFTFDLLKKFPALDFNSAWGLIDGVEAVSPTQVKFTFKSPTALGPEKLVLTPIVPEHVWKDIKDPVTFANENPVGSGPMTEIRRFTPEIYEQCRNPHYWDADNLKVDCFRFPQVSTNDQALAAAQSGSLDWFASFLPDIEKTYVANDPEHYKYWLPPGNMVAFTMNQESPDEGNREAFQNLEFRHAVSLAMDRKSMVDIAGYGYPTLNDDPSGVGASFPSWNNPEVKKQFGQYATFDEAKAKAHLAEAGFKDKDGDGFVETPSGKKIAFDIIVPNGWTDWVDTVKIGVDGLTAIGINAKLATPESTVWRQQLVDGTFNMAITSYVVGTTPYLQLSDAFHSRNKGKTRFTAQRFFTPELDKLLDSFEQTTDDGKRHDILNQVQMIVAENMPYVPVYNNPVWYEYNTKRFTGWASPENPFVSPQNSDNNHDRLLHLLALRPVQ